MNTSDLRVIKTKRNIENAFLALLQQKDFHAITVQDILSTALINRSTFYKHYVDKYALSESLCQDIFIPFEDYVDQRFNLDANANLLQNTVKELYAFLSQNRTKILALFKVQTETIHLYDDMFSCLKNKFLQTEHKDNGFPEKFYDYLATIYATFVMGSIRWCLENDGYEELVPYAKEFLSFSPFSHPDYSNVPCSFSISQLFIIVFCKSMVNSMPHFHPDAIVPCIRF